MVSFNNCILYFNNNDTVDFDYRVFFSLPKIFAVIFLNKQPAATFGKQKIVKNCLFISLGSCTFYALSLLFTCPKPTMFNK